MTPVAPGRALGLALIGWGLGDLVLERRAAAVAWLASELAAALLVIVLTVNLADTTLYLVPYLAGLAFIAIWAFQAVSAYRRAQRSQGAIAPTPVRSPAAAIAWLGVPLLAWGTGFWLIAASSSSPDAALDRFVAGGDLCRMVAPAAGCPDTADLSAIRVRLTARSGSDATAVAERVHYVSRPSRFLGIFSGSELVPISEGNLLTIRLRRDPGPTLLGLDLGAGRWRAAEVVRGISG